ncbi:MAG: hypothetical protein LCH66_14250 [Actinobacteria bacterium]|jgi:hypothetical protein|nr:hypothetical protein [Actinomycetota bacterium]
MDLPWRISHRPLKNPPVVPSASPGEAVDLLARVCDVNPLTRRDALFDLGWLVVSAIGVG